MCVCVAQQRWMARKDVSKVEKFFVPNLQKEIVTKMDVKNGKEKNNDEVSSKCKVFNLKWVWKFHFFFSEDLAGPVGVLTRKAF